ncbi:DUF4245 family protein [Brachybacterium vulturis]|uniref:DUF4245 family protein n=1 Tax=Brachybacterium vulturis TaxID=2017484 RepID=UPI003734FAD1
MHDADHETPEVPERTPAVRTDEPGAPSDEPAPQPKSAYELPSKKNTVLRNMVWALLLTMAVVVVVGIAFFGVGSQPEREPLANSELDVAASAERARDVAPFPVTVPAVGEGWTERSARYTAGANPQWTIEYTSPEGQLVTLVEESELGAPMLSAAIPGSTVEEELELAGATCSLLRGERSTAERGIACEGAGWGFVVHGNADRAALEQIAGAAVTSLD